MATTIIVYLLPDSGVTNTLAPAYLKSRFVDGLAVKFSYQRYGSTRTVYLTIVEAEDADHAWLAAQPNVYQFPADLDTTPSAQQLSELKSYLELFYIPADWVNPSNTYREILRVVNRMFQTLQRWAGVDNGKQPTDYPVTLNTQVQAAPAEFQAALIAVSDSFGYPTADIQGNWTLRRVLKWLGDQWPLEMPIYFAYFGDYI